MRSYSGVSLFELMLTIALTSILSLMLYQVLVSVQKTSQILKAINNLHVHRAQAYFHLYRDSQALIAPPYDFYLLIDEIMKKKDNKKSDEDDNKKNNSSDKSEKKEYSLEEKYNFYKKYFPLCIKNDSVISIVLPTSRNLLTFSESPFRAHVTYTIEPRKEGSGFMLKRKEEPFVMVPPAEKNDTKNISSYTLIEHLENIHVTWYMPTLKKEIIEKSEKENDIIPVYQAWREKVEYTEKEIYSLPEDPKKIYENLIYPYAFSITGIMRSNDQKKQIPFIFTTICQPVCSMTALWISAYYNYKKNNKDSVQKDPPDPDKPGAPQ